VIENLPLIQITPTRHPSIREDQNYLMTPKERGVLVTLMNVIEAVTVVEIGINEGLCAEIMLKAVPSIRRYVGVDVEQGYVTSMGVQQNQIPEVPGKYALPSGYLELIVRPRGSLDLRIEDLPVCDVMLIDGDHGREAVQWDTHLAINRVRPGGLILWHDYYLAEWLADTDTFNNNPLDVTAVLNELAANGKGWNIRHIEDTWLAMMWR
jgi:predicted O-methyltransferase YrrM